MNRTIAVKLKTTQEQDEVLNSTVAQSDYCFNQIARYGWEHNERNQVNLHHANYYKLRELYPKLPAQLIISKTSKAKEALSAVYALKKKGVKVSCPTQKSGSIRYDARSYSIIKDVIGISSIAGRLKFPLHLYRHAKKWWDQAIGYQSADLIKKDSGWWLHIVLDIPDIKFVENGKVIGVDLGINRPAVTSENQFLGERRWKEIENRYFRHKRKLHSKGTKSAKRRLRSLSGKQRRFRNNCDHILSKSITQNLRVGSIVVLENLTGIRQRTKQRGVKQRRKHHSWSYAQLRSFVEYKSEGQGCRVVVVDPRNTSRRCSYCGHIDKENRKSQSVFLCQMCGCELNADLNAARNIRQKYLDGIGKSDSVGLLSTSLMFPVYELRNKPLPSGDGC